MRTFYFDCGIYRIAQLAECDPQHVPRIQYCTTTRSDPGRDPGAPGVKMLDYLGGLPKGLELYRTSGRNFTHPDMNTWTLVPRGPRLSRGASHVWSNRDDRSKPILHGFEGLFTQQLARRLTRWRSLAVDGGIDAAGQFLPDRLLSHSADATMSALTLLLIVAATATISTLEVRRGIHRELDGLATNHDEYQPVQKLADWHEWH